MSVDPNADALNRIRRFWKEVSLREEAAGGLTVMLDHRAGKTPGGTPLTLPTRALAEIVAAEWAGQPEHVNFAAMPATRLAFTAIEKVAGAREAIADEMARYADADLLCYFAEEPDALRLREAERWGPILDWAWADLGLSFVRAAGVVHQEQPPETLARVRALTLELDEFRLAALSWGAALFGSVTLAFALERGRLSGDEAFDLSRLDETFQAERWGVDAEAKARDDLHRAEAVLLERWFAALATPA